jgi:hypothetical protein
MNMRCVLDDAEGETLIMMFLKAPGILIFLVSIILALAVFYSRYFGTDVPFLTGEASQFYVLFAAYAILVLGCIMRRP